MGEASSSSSIPQGRIAPESVPRTQAAIKRSCPYCGHVTTQFRRHVAASKTCSRRHALHYHQIGQNSPAAQPLPHPHSNDPPEFDIYSDLPIEDQPPYIYDIDHDYETIDRLRDMGILPNSGFELAPRLRNIDIATVRAQRLSEDLDLLLDDLAPRNDDDATDAGDFDIDPFPDHEEPLLLTNLHISPPPLPDENSVLPKHHVPDDLYTHNLYGLKYTSGRAGKPIRVDGVPKRCADAYQKWEAEWKLKEGECPFRPFQNLMEWEICQWAMLSGPSKFSADWLLNIPTVSTLSYDMIPPVDIFREDS